LTFQWRDNSYRILSLLLALLLWVYVTNEQNPVSDQSFSVPLTARDLPQGYVVAGLPGAVNVRVRGASLVINALRRDDFSALVNLSGVKSGRQEVKVQLNAPHEVEVLQISPATVVITADQVAEKKVPVVAVLKGSVADGLQAGAPVVDPANATVSGPSAALAKISQLSVTVNVSGAKAAVTSEAPLESGLTGVTVSPARVRVTVPVTALPVQSLPVRLQLTGEPASGYALAGTTVRPQTVQVTARDNALHGLTVINTKPLDISGIDADMEKDVALVLPDGVSLLQPERVTVTVNVNRVEVQQTSQPPPDGNETGEAVTAEPGAVETGAEPAPAPAPAPDNSTNGDNNTNSDNSGN